MRDFAIRFDFRGNRYAAIVHRHIDHINVWFTDSLLVHAFGGLIVYTSDYTIKEAKKTEEKDYTDFHHAIIKELKKLENQPAA
jgi:hypothetical protein